MKPRRTLWITLCVGGLALGGAASVPAAAASAAGAPGAASPKQAVLVLIAPRTRTSRAACNTVTGKLRGCPVTARFRQALARELDWERRHPGGAGNVFCRCQNPPSFVGVRVLDNSGRLAHVNAHMVWSSRVQNLIYVTVHHSGGWLVDDSYCAGHPNTSVYHIPIGPCP